MFFDKVGILKYCEIKRQIKNLKPNFKNGSDK